MVTSKKTYTNTHLLGLRLPVPLSTGQTTADPHLLRRPSNRQAGLAQSLVRSREWYPTKHLLFLLIHFSVLLEILVLMQISLVAATSFSLKLLLAIIIKVANENAYGVGFRSDPLR